MTYEVPGHLRYAAENAIAQGVAFLQADVTEEGAWPSENHIFDQEPQIEYAMFVAACGILALQTCRDQRIAEIVERTKRFLVQNIGPQGLWSYVPGLHPDLDDSSVCAMAIGPSGHSALFMGRNLEPILANRDSEGRFLTWIREPGMPNDVDSVVNANVISMLGHRTETSGAESWIENLVRENRESGSSLWYVPVMDLYYCVSRASQLAAPAFASLRSILIERILETKVSNPLQIAQALTALDYLKIQGESEFVHQRLEELIAAQQDDGSWPSCEVWRGPEELGFIFWSKTLTSAYCIEALSRTTQTHGST